MSDFDWSNDASVVFPSVMAVAVYVNEDGNVVIRQKDVFDDDDQFVAIPVENVPALIESLEQVIAEDASYA